MGSVVANKSEFADYFITVGQLGGIGKLEKFFYFDMLTFFQGRIDFYMFYYKYTSKSLSEVTSDCLITSLVISSVDPGELNGNDVSVILENNYSAKAQGETDEMVKDRLEKIKELIMKEIKTPS
jgi:hypothetical protein